MGIIKILLLADTHLGIDQPAKPRIKRRRRGDDFHNNYLKALDLAKKEKVDFVVHGGDILYRSRVKPELVEKAFAPLKQLADSGIPVYLVPGNHERSKIPHRHLAEHNNIFIFDHPQTYVYSKDGINIGLVGFPCVRVDIRQDFKTLLKATDYEKSTVDCNLLCVHQAFEGAQVGVQNYTFRNNKDVIRLTDIPNAFSAVLSGHIHRQQILNQDLNKTPIATPVIYPGSIERTSFAERKEKKGVVLITIKIPEHNFQKVPDISLETKFIELPTRPMIQTTIDLNRWQINELQNRLSDFFTPLPENSIIRIRIKSIGSPEQKALLSAPNLRKIAPDTMNITTDWVDYRKNKITTNN